MKRLAITIFGVYIILLLWLVLFKFSYDIASVLANYQSRSINIIPFLGPKREMVDNLMVFIPFGLLLCVNFKQVAFRTKLAVIFAFSLAIETIQYILAIGISDITDIIMNTLGGLIGLFAYKLGSKYISEKKLDTAIVVTGMCITIIFLFLRIFVFKVRY